MSSASIDKASNEYSRELTRFRNRRRRLVRLILTSVFLLIGWTFIRDALGPAFGGGRGIEEARQSLMGSGQEWAQDLATAQFEYSAWLTHHAMGIEVSFFDDLSQLLFLSAESISSAGNNRGDRANFGFLINLAITGHSAALRVLFVVMAAWKLWVCAIIVGMLARARTWKPHSGKDLLGQMGTGGLYYSGLRASLDKVSPGGAPELHVTGLACPASTSEAELAGSPLGRLLSAAGVSNGTNRELAQIILAHKEHPAYIPFTEEEERAHERYFAGAGLIEHTAEVLERLLELQHSYKQGEFNDPSCIEDQFGHSEIADERVGGKEYAWMMQRAAHSVLTPTLRACLAEIPAAELATVVLALFAGKVMAYGFQGGKWIRRSNFPELCARSVLHSVPSYGDDYGYDSRTLIRRALIYGSRRSVFAPVRFPIDLDDPTRSLRQVVEVMMCLPHELEGNADDIELVGWLHEMHRDWSKKFFDGIIAGREELTVGVYATLSNLYLLSIEKLVAIGREAIAPEVLKRVHELVSRVSLKQRQQYAALENSPDAKVERGALHGQGRFAVPLTASEIQKLTPLHGIQGDPLTDWSALRAMLNNYSWLARRVGDYSVPEHGVIFAVIAFDTPNKETNELNLVGRPGMIAIRGTRMESRFGKNWQNRYTLALSATMSETREDFEKLMKGIDDSVPEDGFGSSFAIG